MGCRDSGGFFHDLCLRNVWFGLFCIYKVLCSADFGSQGKSSAIAQPVRLGTVLLPQLSYAAVLFGRRHPQGNAMVHGRYESSQQ